MPIPIQCPNCGKAGTVADSFAGKHVRCPQCKYKMLIPDRNAPGMTSKPKPKPVAMEVLDELEIIEELEESVEAKPIPKSLPRNDNRHDNRRDDRRDSRHNERYNDRPQQNQRRLCPFCDSDVRPVERKKMSVVGIVVAILSAVTCFIAGFCLIIPWFFVPFCFLFLLITEGYRMCPDCGARV